MEDIIWVFIVIGVIWNWITKLRKAGKPAGPPPAPRREMEVEFEQFPEEYYEELPPALFAEAAEEKSTAPEPVAQEGVPIIPPLAPVPRSRRKCFQGMPNLKAAMAWSVILAPPVGLPSDEAREG
jgi:hypothetical protein